MLKKISDFNFDRSRRVLPRELSTQAKKKKNKAENDSNKKKLSKYFDIKYYLSLIFASSEVDIV